MTDFQIENTPGVAGGWDFALDDGDLVLTHTLGRPAEVAQRVVMHMMVHRGELTYDVTAGIPWVDGVFGEPIPGIAQLLTYEATTVEGVAEVETPSYLLDDRELAVSLGIRVTGTDDLVAVTLAVVP